MTKDLEDFGKQFIVRVRDAAMSDLEWLLSGRYNSVSSRELIAKLEKQTGVEAAHEVLPEAVNSVLFKMLQFIEEEDRLSVSWNGTEVRRVSDGLMGDVVGQDGWIVTYSKTRHGKVT